MKKIIVLVSCILLYHSLALSQIIHPQNRAIVAFHAKVIEDSDFHFLYSYEIANQESSAEAFDSFTLLLVDSLLAYDYTTVQTPTNKKWYIDGDGSIGSVSGAAASRFFNLPLAPADALFPGESMSFSFPSPGLPSIRTYYAQSFALPLTIEEMDSLHALGYTDKQIMPSWKDDSYKNQTVTPIQVCLSCCP